MYKVREAKFEDLLKIHELAKELLENSVYRGIEMDDTKFKRIVVMLMSSKLGKVFVVVDAADVPVGFLVGMVEDLFFSKKKYATDLCIYVKDEARAYGAFLVQRFVQWAKTIPSVVEITMGISSGIGDIDRVGEMYKKIGFTHTGGLYVMRTQT